MKWHNLIPFLKALWHRPAGPMNWKNPIRVMAVVCAMRSRSSLIWDSSCDSSFAMSCRSLTLLALHLRLPQSDGDGRSGGRPRATGVNR